MRDSCTSLPQEYSISHGRGIGLLDKSATKAPVLTDQQAQELVKDLRRKAHVKGQMGSPMQPRSKDDTSEKCRPQGQEEEELDGEGEGERDGEGDVKGIGGEDGVMEQAANPHGSSAALATNDTPRDPRPSSAALATGNKLDADIEQMKNYITKSLLDNGLGLSSKTAENTESVLRGKLYAWQTTACIRTVCNHNMPCSQGTLTFLRRNIHFTTVQ